MSFLSMAAVFFRGWERLALLHRPLSYFLLLVDWDNIVFSLGLVVVVVVVGFFFVYISQIIVHFPV